MWLSVESLLTKGAFNLNQIIIITYRAKFQNESDTISPLRHACRPIPRRHANTVADVPPNDACAPNEPRFTTAGWLEPRTDYDATNASKFRSPGQLIVCTAHRD